MKRNKSLSESSCNIIAFLFVAVFHAHIVHGAFSLSPTPANFVSTINSRSSSKLQAIVLPAEQEDEKKKKKKNKSGAAPDESSSSDDWTTTNGGFIPNIFKKKDSSTHSKIHLVDNIDDYKRLVADEQNQIVVVRFFAKWCRSCKVSKPQFNKLVHTFAKSSVKFVEVPLSKDTAYLHEGLGVPSIPFAHIYHPQAGLVEEIKISKPHFSTFVDKLQSYVVGSCDIPDDRGETDCTVLENVGSFE